MTPETLREIGECLYGDRWQAPLARAIGINDRTMRDWATGKGRPDAAMAKLAELLAARQKRISAAAKTLVARPATHWYRTDMPDGMSVLWIDGNEGTGRCIVSVYDQRSTEPSCRIDGAGRQVPLGESDDPYPETGLVVYGLHKWDRPTVVEFAAIDAAIAVAIAVADESPADVIPSPALG